MIHRTVRVHLFDDIVTRANRREVQVQLGLVPGVWTTTGAELVAWVRTHLKAERLVIVRNGTPVEAAELADVDVDALDEFHCAPRPADLATGIMLAIAIASAAASAYLATTIKAPRATQESDGQERRFGFGRFSSPAVLGSPIPFGYGRRRRWGGKVISTIPCEASDGSGVSKLRMLIALNDGEVQEIAGHDEDFTGVASGTFGEGGIFLNDQPFSAFPACTASGRLGTQDQAIIPGFSDIERLSEVGVGGVTLRNTDGVERTGPDASAEAFTFTTTGTVEAAVVRVFLPGGLYQVTGTGQVETLEVEYRYRWRESAGPGTWSAWTVQTLERAEQSEFVSAPRLDNLFAPAAGEVIDIQVERVSVESGLASDVDELVWDSVREITYSDLTYPGIALLALELTAGEQLAGVPRAGVDVKLSKVRVWDGISDPADPDFVFEYSENPAWHALDFLTNTTRGMGATYRDEHIDFPSLIAWAQYCDEMVDRPDPGGGAPIPQRERFRFHFVLEEARDGIDWLRTICRAGRCLPSTSGGVWRFIVDRPQANPVEVFTDGSILADEHGAQVLSYRREYAKEGLTRPNQLVCQFENELADGQPETVAVPQVGELWLGGEDGDETPRPETIRLEGITDPDQVLSELAYLIDRTRFLTRTVKFTTVKPVVVVQPGERFDLATTLLAWGDASGRVRADSTRTSVRLDRTVTLVEGVTYTVRVIHGDNTAEVRAVTAPAGVYAPGEPIAVDPTGGGFAAAPAEWEEYSLGRSGLEVKPFICTGVRPAVLPGGGLGWEVEGLEYDDEVYDAIPGNVVLPVYSGLGSIFTPPGPVLDLRGYERVFQGQTQAVLSWNQLEKDRLITRDFRIYRRRLGTVTWVLTPTASIAQRGAVVDISEHDVAYQFCVVAVSQVGSALSPYDPRVPIVSIAFGLSEPPPPPPDDPTLTHTGGNTYRLEWTAVEDAVAYQVIARGLDVITPLTWGSGPRDCAVIARTTDTFLAGLELPPGEFSTFWVRSIGRNGRLSFRATPVSGTGAMPPGESEKQNVLFDSGSTLTLVDCDWVDPGDGDRLRMDDVDTPASMTTEEQDSGGLTLTEITLFPQLVNDHLDPTLDSDPFRVPSIAADQWGIYEPIGEDRYTAMIMPPWPDDAQAWHLEVRTHDGVSWSAWTSCHIGQSVRRTFQMWQARVRMTSGGAPYRPSLTSLRAVLTH